MASSQLPLHARVARTGDQLSADLDREAVVLSLGRGKYFGLNEVGTFIWNQLEGDVTVARLCELVVERYAVSDTRAQEDILDLLGRLRDEGLVEVSA